MSSIQKDGEERVKGSANDEIWVMHLLPAVVGAGVRGPGVVGAGLGDSVFVELRGRNTAATSVRGGHVCRSSQVNVVNTCA